MMEKARFRARLVAFQPDRVSAASGVVPSRWQLEGIDWANEIAKLGVEAAFLARRKMLTELGRLMDA